ncbi:MAG: hypothetical protein ACRDL5_06070, partial [Solirubrobacteraceae bacterium]
SCLARGKPCLHIQTGIRRRGGAWVHLSGSSSVDARADARRRCCFPGRPSMPVAGIPVLAEDEGAG